MVTAPVSRLRAEWRSISGIHVSLHALGSVHVARIPRCIVRVSRVPLVLRGCAVHAPPTVVYLWAVDGCVLEGPGSIAYWEPDAVDVVMAFDIHLAHGQLCDFWFQFSRLSYNSDGIHIKEVRIARLLVHSIFGEVSHVVSAKRPDIGRGRWWRRGRRFGRWIGCLSWWKGREGRWRRRQRWRHR